MTQLALELSQLEIEPIELQEMGGTHLQQEQNRNLETLTATESKNDVLSILTLATSLPVNASCGGGCGSCSNCSTCSPPPHPCCLSCNCLQTCIVINCNSCYNCSCKQ